MNTLVTSANVKFGMRSSSRGTRGASARRSATMNMAMVIGRATNPPMTAGWVTPHSVLWRIASISAPTTSDRETAPATSNRTVRRSPSGRMSTASTRAPSARTAWTTKMRRHPNRSMSGPPSASPMEGAPAPTSDQ